MMWGVIIFIAFSYAAAYQETSHGIRVNCEPEDEFPADSDDASPSLLQELKLELVTKGGKDKLNISWAINVDVSINYLTGTQIQIDGEAPYICKYNPSLAKANLTGLKQVWFHFEARASPGYYVVQAANLPLPPPESGVASKSAALWIYEKPKPTADETTVKTTIHKSIPDSDSKLTENGNHLAITVVAVLGGLLGLMVLISCVIIYKVYGKYCTSLGFTKLPTSSTVPVSVLLVYPAENPAFQKVIVALAEFLQWHGGCSVAVDMWQQGKIAELGPMRWLAEQAESAERVLVICPQLNLCPPSHSFPGHSVPAAAHDLYPLVLNMVGSLAKSPGDLAKFWAVQLGEQQDEKPGSLVVELRACKSFCLMKDLNTLCRSLHVQRQDAKKTLGLKFRPGISYSEKNTEKLRDAIRQLARCHPSTTKELELLKTVIISI